MKNIFKLAILMVLVLTDFGCASMTYSRQETMQREQAAGELSHAFY